MSRKHLYAHNGSNRDNGKDSGIEAGTQICNNDKPTDTETQTTKNKTKRLMRVRTATKIVRIIIRALFYIAYMEMLVLVLPYVSGEKVLESPFTTSQITALLLVGFLVISLKRVKI